MYIELEIDSELDDVEHKGYEFGDAFSENQEVLFDFLLAAFMRMNQDKRDAFVKFSDGVNGIKSEIEEKS